jgi:hypothetical protein
MLGLLLKTNTFNYYLDKFGKYLLNSIAFQTSSF